MSESLTEERVIWDTVPPDIDESLERLPNSLEADAFSLSASETAPVEPPVSHQKPVGQTMATEENVQQEHTLSRREYRQVRKTAEFKAAWKEKKRELRLDGREQRELGKPSTWLNPDRWFEAEKTVAAKTALISKMAVRFAFDSKARQEMLETEVSRRQMLGGILGTMGFAAATGAALAIRHQTKVVQAGLEKLWPENEPTFNFLGGETHREQTQIGIFFPGFGDMHARSEAEQWQANGELEPNMPVGYLDYSNEGATPKQLADLIRQNVDITKLESVVMFGRSMGGPMELAVAAELGIPVKSMILCSSPFEIADGSYGNIGEIVASVPNDKLLASEAKFGVNLWKAFKKHWLNVPEDVVEAWHETTTGAAPWALQPEVKFLAGFDFYDNELCDKLEKVLLAGWTEIVYVESNKPQTDKTVDDIAASMKYSIGLAKRFGIKLSIFGAPYDGHADVGASSTRLAPWIEASSVPTPIPSKNTDGAKTTIASGPLASGSEH
jgi:hypothetical protein